MSSEDGKIVIISSVESEDFYVMSQQASNQFDIYGQLRADGYIHSIGYYMKDNTMKALAVLSNNLVQCFDLPTAVYENRLEPMP